MKMVDVLSQKKNEYCFPPLSLLDKSNAEKENSDVQENSQRQTAELLVNTLKEFGVQTSLVGVSHGPSVTRYELQPNAGVKISRITGLADDIALRLAATGGAHRGPHSRQSSGGH